MLEALFGSGLQGKTSLCLSSLSIQWFRVAVNLLKILYFASFRFLFWFSLEQERNPRTCHDPLADMSPNTRQHLKVMTPF
jgi:hypothetical protein